jgi:endonuclease-3
MEESVPEKKKRGTTEDKKARAWKIWQRLSEAYPRATTALSHRSPFELLVATILSAQCTDVRVNAVTQSLFKKYRKPEDYLAVPSEELEEDIRPTGFFRNKAKSIRGLCQALIENHKGQVPQTMEEMVKLPGVGRKTANVVLGSAFGLATGVVVDTHVRRLSFRMGLTREDDPEKIEQDLMKILPSEVWVDFGHAMIWHGRQVCIARKPKCSSCMIADLCPKSGVTVHA